MGQIHLALLLAIFFLPSILCFLSCDEALKAIEPYDPSVKSCQLVHGMPIIKYQNTKGIPGSINCDTIPGILTSQGRSVQDCLTVNGSSFFRIDQLYDWQGAWIACHGVPGGNLASVRNIQELIATMQLIETEDENVSLDSWIGLNDIDQEGVYRWSDDSSVATYRKLLAGEPNGGRSENCFAATRSNRWHWPNHYVANSGWFDATCGANTLPICKVSPM